MMDSGYGITESDTVTLSTSSEKQGSSIGKLLLKAGVLLGFLLAALCLIYFTPLREWLMRAPEISDYLKTLGWAAPVVFVAAVALLTALGVPRLLLCPIAGMSFLFYWGLLWGQIGTLIGFYATFLFVRWGGRDVVSHKWPKLERLAHRFTRKGFLSVFLIRQMPVGGFYLNILLGLTPVRHRDFLIGTLLGILPEAIPATLIGASAKQVSISRILEYIVAAVIIFVIAGLVLRWYLRVSQSPVADIVRKFLGNDNVTEE